MCLNVIFWLRRGQTVMAISYSEYDLNCVHIKLLPQVAIQALEDPEGHLEKRENSTAMVICRRSVDPQRGRLQFKIISVLTVEGKVFFSIVAKWLAFFLKNGYIDTSVQKAAQKLWQRHHVSAWESQQDQQHHNGADWGWESLQTAPSKWSCLLWQWTWWWNQLNQSAEALSPGLGSINHQSAPSWMTWQWLPR